MIDTFIMLTFLLGNEFCEMYKTESQNGGSLFRRWFYSVAVTVLWNDRSTRANASRLSFQMLVQ